MEGGGTLTIACHKLSRVLYDVQVQEREALGQVDLGQKAQ
jgi:hypothetical protein